MIGYRRPPRLLVRTLIGTFAMVALLLIAVFGFVRMSLREQVRQTIADNLDQSQRTIAALENRRQRDLQAQAATLAENPTLKAALDTYAAETRDGISPSLEQLRATIRREIGKLAARVEADAIVLVDGRGTALAAAGPLGDRWPEGRPVPATPAPQDGDIFDGILQARGDTMRIVGVPLTLDGSVTIGTLYLATAIDQSYAEQLDRMSRARTAVLSDGVVIATTLPPAAAQEFETALTRSNAEQGIVMLGDGSHAYRQLAKVGTARFYALSSIDEASSAAITRTNQSLAIIAVGAFLLALVGSTWLANALIRPIENLSSSLAEMADARDVHVQLPAARSSRELETLTQTFNTLMASVAEAEAHTEAAYAGAIRALAAALDARDPYTAGHSDRVSVLSVAVGRALELETDDLEVLRLGALLHDIGKIGVPDDVLRKAGPLTASEYDAIKQHPVLGAKILRNVPFFARHIAIVELHHERPDGRGYPHGLRGDDIPLVARVVHVADAYDAITSARAYRAPRTSGEALRELWRCAGTEFDAQIVGALAVALPGVTSDAELPESQSAHRETHSAIRHPRSTIPGPHYAGPTRVLSA
jgi:putative nucleotidyltransferase with HDIG domain